MQGGGLSHCLRGLILILRTLVFLGEDSTMALIVFSFLLVWFMCTPAVAKDGPFALRAPAPGAGAGRVSEWGATLGQTAPFV